MSLSKTSRKESREAMSVMEKSVEQAGEEPASTSGNRQFSTDVPLRVVEDDDDSDWLTVSDEDGDSDWETLSEEDEEEALETADKNMQMGHDPYIKRTQEILCKEKIRAAACKGKKRQSGIWKLFSFGRGNKVAPLASILKSDGENQGDQAIGSHQSDGKSDG